MANKKKDKTKIDQPEYDFEPPHKIEWTVGVGGHRKRYYERGWVVGNYGVKFLQETEEQSLTKKPKRRADFICPLCGGIFNARIDAVESGKVKSDGCRKSISSSINAYNMSILRQQRTVDITGEKFGCLTALQPTDLRDSDGNVYWICKCDCGGSFTTTARSLRKGHSLRCPKCRWKARAEQYVGKRFGKLVIKDLVPDKRASNGGVLCVVECDCGNITKINLSNILRGQESCGKCIVSKGENKIEMSLLEHNIEFTQQENFNKSMKQKNSSVPCRADFYLPKQKIVIEYNGQQHYGPYDFFGGEEGFKKTLERDLYKTNYYSSHGLALIKIPYTDYDILNWDYLKMKGVVSE